jgi:SAM-dependent methyltransferase
VTSNQIRFDDGAAYEQYMGHWSQLAGEIFLDWIAPKSGLRWLDVGCGSGAFTELIVSRCAPASVHGIDPSEAQLVFARARRASRMSEFSLGDAMALPFITKKFDVAVMPLVIFFVPEPLKGVEEMARVVSLGGAVTAYAWDIKGGGFPYNALQSEMRAIGFSVPASPSSEASRLDVMQGLWDKAGLEAIETRKIVVQRTFIDFDDYWATVQSSPSVAAKLAAMAAQDILRLKTRIRERLPADALGRITYSAHANAVKGRVPS